MSPTGDASGVEITVDGPLEELRGECSGKPECMRDLLAVWQRLREAARLEEPARRNLAKGREAPKEGVAETGERP